MAYGTPIPWSHHTFNPWIGCTKVSPGCVNCYAEALALRRGWAKWGPTAPRRIASEGYWVDAPRWNARAAKRHVRERVFCASMADVFEDRRDLDAPRERLFALIEKTGQLDWLLLTKRPENADRLAPARWRAGWPAHVWAGVTVEDQTRADERIPLLRAIPAAMRFPSVEPLLEPVVLSLEDIGWVIAGGESGKGYRPFELDWVRQVRDQCAAARVPFFFKQVGGATPTSGSRMLDGRTWDEVPRSRAEA